MNGLIHTFGIVLITSLLSTGCGGGGSGDSGGGGGGGRDPVPDLPIDTSTSPVGSNLVQPTDFSGEFPFVDHMKMARPWFSGTDASFQDGRTLAKDADGWPVSLLAGQVARSVIFTNGDIGSRLAGSRFVVVKSGDGDIE